MQVLYSLSFGLGKRKHNANILRADYGMPILFIIVVTLIFFCFISTGFAFVYFMDERDAEDAIRGLDNRPFGYDRRRLSVEWARVHCYYQSCFCHLYFYVYEVSSIFLTIF